MSVLLLQLCATSAVSTLSLHDALPISSLKIRREALGSAEPTSVAACDRKPSLGSGEKTFCQPAVSDAAADRKSTRLNSSHLVISYAVFCLTKKKSCVRNARNR